MRGWPFFSVIALATLLPASVAEACPGCSQSTYAVMPGGGLWAVSALPWLMVLQGVLERPFVSWAGIGKASLLPSIGGSFMAGLAVHAIGTVGWPMSWSLAILNLPLLLGLPIGYWLLKSIWLRLGKRSIRLLPGVVLSTLVIVTLPIWMSVFDFDARSHVKWAQRLYPTVSLVVVPLGFAILIRSIIRTRPPPPVGSAPPAIGVIPVDPMILAK